MPKSKKHVPFAQKMRQKRHQAGFATDAQVAANIWGELVYVFSCYSAYELECFEALSIIVTEKQDRLALSVTTISCGDDSEDMEEWEDIYMSSKKLYNIAQIMHIVMLIADREDVRNWTDVDNDGQRFWEFCIEFEVGEV